MFRLTLQISDELHDKLRWLAYNQQRSQRFILRGIVKKA